MPGCTKYAVEEDLGGKRESIGAGRSRSLINTRRRRVRLRPGVHSSASFAAARYCCTTLTWIRPRSRTSKPCSLAPPRTVPPRCRLNASALPGAPVSGRSCGHARGTVRAARRASGRSCRSRRSPSECRRCEAHGSSAPPPPDRLPAPR